MPLARADLAGHRASRERGGKVWERKTITSMIVLEGLWVLCFKKHTLGSTFAAPLYPKDIFRTWF